MSDTNSAAQPGAAALPRPPQLSITRRRLIRTFRNPLVIIGLVIIGFWVLMAIGGPALRPYTYIEIISTPWTAPSADFWLGTDRMGRDMFARLAVGARLMLLLPVIAVSVGVALGAFIGLITGYFGGLVDDIVMRLMDIVMAFPIIMLYLLVIFAIGPSPINVIWAIGLGSAPGIARLVRGLTLDLRGREFVAAAQMRGESSWYIMFSEILPNLTGPILVDACVRVAFAMFTTGFLGFLGLGMPEPTPDWGTMISEGRTWIFTAAWAPVFPMIGLSSLVIALNLLADGLSQAGWVD
ncbi:MAG: ABC transporter permease [Anaerolineales bacterium]|nr:ABC transporter permease [Anaerolineales bacterium]